MDKDQKNDIPTAKVIALRNQGLTDNQIIQSLQHDGYASQQVIESLELADQKNSSIPSQAANFQPPAPQVPIEGNPQSITPPAPSQTQQDSTDVEELIEAIIEEKWATVEADVSRVLEWKEVADESMSEIKADLKHVQKNFDDLHKAILGKVGEYDKNILQVGSQLKAMEEVFSKVLPTFTDNVAELDRIAQKFKNQK